MSAGERFHPKCLKQPRVVAQPPSQWSSVITYTGGLSLKVPSLKVSTKQNSQCSFNSESVTQLALYQCL